MKRYYAYYAVLEPCANIDDGFGVYFPDLDGATSGGMNAEDAAFNAKECLALHLYGLEEEGYPIPKPSEREEIEVPEGCQLVLVSTDVKEFFPEAFRRGGARAGAGRPKNSGRQATKRLVVRMTEEEDEKLTRLAVDAQKTKSEFIRDFIKNAK